MMVGLLVALNWLLPMVYLALLVDYGAAFFLRTRTHTRNHWLLPAIGVHALFLVLRGIHIGHLPIISSYEVLSVLALSMTVVYWIVELGSRDRRTGVFVLLLAFVFQYSASMHMSGTIASADVLAVGSQSNWSRVHVVLALVSYTALAFAGIYGLLNLLSRRELKRHIFGVLFDRLPSLEQLGKMTWYALLLGFVAMTITIAMSPMIVHSAGAAGQSSIAEPKVASKIIIGSVAWIIYAVSVLGRLIGKWSHARVSYIAVYGFLVILVLIVISAMVS